jgi:hypothetical protein
MLLSCHQNVIQNWDIRIGNRSFENVSQFIYLGITVTNWRLIYEDFKRRLNPKRYEVTGTWRKLYNEKLCGFCSLPSKVRMIKLRIK